MAETLPRPVKVFLVEDSALIRARVTELLQAAAMTVVGYARTPEAAIDGILAARPEVVVLDVQLDGGVGLQVLRAVRRAAPGIAFVVFSGNSGPAYRRLYLGAGADSFLDKSTQSDQLVPAVLRASDHVHV
ncbi:MAG TPA: response regulator transcription factor [Polaromonas sp.]|uniref:response regulator n=1 Tax=Polaromonas sp. TaxID=1869339 RepID=UPI002D308ED7|nr:response regulator transcription factor [Polaromonas sp.]HYW58323.1 response regulator transcription factor [Polaromonas sp.]